MRDWYGTSRLFARALISSSIETGRRRDMDSVDGLRFGKAGSAARAQSKYSVVSALAQNRRSSSSLENSGIALLTFGLRLVIDRPFTPAHVARRDHAHQKSSHGEHNRERAI